MLQTKIFPVTKEVEINQLLMNFVPQSITHQSETIMVVYDDGSPITNVQRRNAIRMQIAKQEEKVMQAKVNVDLTKKAEKNIKDSLHKELKEKIRMAHQDAKDTLADEINSLTSLNDLYDSMS